MTPLVICLALLLGGCASTTIYENGVPVMKMQADATNVTLRTARGTYFHADKIVHSEPTRAGGSAAATVIGAGAGLATAIGGAVAVHSAF